MWKRSEAISIIGITEIINNHPIIITLIHFIRQAKFKVREKPNQGEGDPHYPPPFDIF